MVADTTVARVLELALNVLALVLVLANHLLLRYHLPRGKVDDVATPFEIGPLLSADELAAVKRLLESSDHLEPEQRAEVLRLAERLAADPQDPGAGG